MDANSRLFRFFLLSVACFMTLGSYFCIDLPTVLQNQMQGNIHCNWTNASTGNTSCCEDCLGLTPEQFNILFATRAWTACSFVAVSGFLIDRMGNKIAALIFSTGIVLGNSLFALSTMPPIKHTALMFPLMLIGRVLLGLSDFPTRIVQDRITAYWFKGKELSTAFGISITACRIGSVANFLLTPTVTSELGISAAVWFGVILCGIGFLAAVSVALLDAWGVNQIGQSETVQQLKESRSARDVKKLCAEFWFILLVLSFFYASVMSYMSNSVKFIHDMYGINKSDASYISGAVYMVSIVLSPIVGILVDKFGGRAALTISIGILTAPCYVLLGLTIVHPLAITIWMGIVYTITAVAVWSSIALLVPVELMGLALGFTIAFNGFSIGLTNLIIGAILGETNSLSEEETIKRWRLVLIPVTANALCSTLSAIIAVVLDLKRGKRLSHRKGKAKADSAEDTKDLNKTEEIDGLFQSVDDITDSDTHNLLDENASEIN